MSVTQEIYEEKLDKAVATGVAWLDKEYGPGWEHEVKLNDFHMPRECKCVLGWVYADQAEEAEADSGFDYAIEKFAPADEDSTNWAGACGFDIDYQLANEVSGLDVNLWDDLQARWEAVITARRILR